MLTYHAGCLVWTGLVVCGLLCAGLHSHLDFLRVFLSHRQTPPTLTLIWKDQEKVEMNVEN